MNKNPKDKGHITNTVVTGPYGKFKVLLLSAPSPFTLSSNKLWLIKFKILFLLAYLVAGITPSQHSYPFSLPIFWIPSEKRFPLAPSVSVLVCGASLC